MNTTNDTIQSKVLARIKEHHITPRGRWKFIMRQTLLWVPGIIVTIIGTFAVAGILFGLTHAGWEYRPYTRMTTWELFARMIPLVWLIGIALFASLIVRTLRMTARGYRYTSELIIITSCGISLVGGIALFITDMTIARNSIIRFETEHKQRALWDSPDDGRISGIVSISESNTYITDRSGIRWTIMTDELADSSRLVHGESVRVVGINRNGQFIACDVFPWEFKPFGSPTQLPPPPDMMRLPRPRSSSVECESFFSDRHIPHPRERNSTPRS